MSCSICNYMDRHKELKRYVQLELIPPRQLTQFLCRKLDVPSSLLGKKKVNIRRIYLERD